MLMQLSPHHTNDVLLTHTSCQREQRQAVDQAQEAQDHDLACVDVLSLATSVCRQMTADWHR